MSCEQGAHYANETLVGLSNQNIMEFCEGIKYPIQFQT